MCSLAALGVRRRTLPDPAHTETCAYSRTLLRLSTQRGSLSCRFLLVGTWCQRDLIECRHRGELVEGVVHDPL